MEVEHIEGATRVLGEAQGYRALPIRDCTLDDPACSTQRMVSQWRPTIDELELLNQGAPIHLSVLGTAHPPVMLGVGPLPAPQEADALKSHGGCA